MRLDMIGRELPPTGRAGLLRSLRSISALAEAVPWIHVRHRVNLEEMLHCYTRQSLVWNGLDMLGLLVRLERER